MKTQFIKMQSENSALILFIALICSIVGAIIAILSHYPPPAYILGATAFGIAAGGMIAARRESRFIIKQMEPPAPAAGLEDPEYQCEVDFSLK